MDSEPKKKDRKRSITIPASLLYEAMKADNETAFKALCVWLGMKGNFTASVFKNFSYRNLALYFHTDRTSLKQAVEYGISRNWFTIISRLDKNGNPVRGTNGKPIVDLKANRVESGKSKRLTFNVCKAKNTKFIYIQSYRRCNEKYAKDQTLADIKQVIELSLITGLVDDYTRLFDSALFTLILQNYSKSYQRLCYKQVRYSYRQYKKLIRKTLFEMPAETYNIVNKGLSYEYISKKRFFGFISTREIAALMKIAKKQKLFFTIHSFAVVRDGSYVRKANEDAKKAPFKATAKSSKQQLFLNANREHYVQESAKAARLKAIKEQQMGFDIDTGDLVNMTKYGCYVPKGRGYHLLRATGTICIIQSKVYTSGRHRVRKYAKKRAEMEAMRNAAKSNESVETTPVNNTLKEAI